MSKQLFDLDAFRAQPLPTESEIIANWQGDIEKPIVSICCITYNHESYIEDALVSFLNQETDFPFEIIVRDDASTDLTSTIIKKYEKLYPKIIKPIYETENGFQKGIKPGDIAIKKAIGEYIAFCEGDDYWTCEDKLQFQRDFLRDNQEYSFCWTRFQVLDQTTGNVKPDSNSKYFLKEGEGVEFSINEFCYTGWHIGMQTLFFPKKLRDPRLAQLPEYRDVFMLSDFLTKSKGYCLPDFYAVYRVHDAGIHSGIDDWKKLQKAVQIYRAIALTFIEQHDYKRKYFKFSDFYILSSFRRLKFNLALAEINKRKDFQSAIKIWGSIFIAILKAIVNKFKF